VARNSPGRWVSFRTKPQARPAFDEPLDVVSCGGEVHHDDAALSALPADPFDHVEAVVAPQAHVEEDHVRLEPADQAERTVRGSPGRRRDSLTSFLSLNNAEIRLAEEAVILKDQDFDARCSTGGSSIVRPG